MTNTSKARSRLAATAALLLAALVLTGCLNVSYGIEVNEDGSGTMTLELIASKELVAALEGSFGEEISGKDFADEIREDPPGGVAEEDFVVEEISDDRGEGAKVTFAFDSLDEINDVLGSGDDGDLISSVEIAQSGENWTFTATATPPESALDGEFQALSAALTGQVSGDATAALTVKLPGQVKETNGEEVDGAVRWDLASEDLPSELKLVTGPGGGLPIVGLVTVLVVLAAGGAAAFFVWTRQRQKATAPSYGTTPPVYPPAAPGPYGVPDPYGTPPAADPYGTPPAADPYGTPPAAGHDPYGTPPAADPHGTPPAAGHDPYGTPPAADPHSAVTPPPMAPAPPPAPAGPPPGWYQDPANPAGQRWWTGSGWGDAR